MSEDLIAVLERYHASKVDVTRALMLIPAGSEPFFCGVPVRFLEEIIGKGKLMAVMDNYKRRIRVIGKPGDEKGYAITVSDDETGEQILNVKAITVHMEANAVTTAEVTYVAGKDHEQTITLEQPSVDVSAMELNKTLDWYPQAVRDWLSEIGVSAIGEGGINFDTDVFQDGSDGDWIKHRPGDHVTVTTRAGEGFGAIDVSARFKINDKGWIRVEDEKIEPGDESQ